MKIIPQLSALDKARFWKKVNKDSNTIRSLENPDLYSHVVGNCWEWTGVSNKGGYGIIVLRKERYIATRTAYCMQYGVDPENFFVCHHCDNPKCVRKEHLYLGTPKDNTSDMVRRERFALRIPSDNLLGEPDKRYTLTEKDVRCIYYRYWTEEGLSQSDLAQEYNIEQTNIGLITRGDNWSHITSKMKLPYKLNKECIKDKLTESDIYEIFRLYNSREMTRSEIAKKFNIAVSSLDQILRGEKWSHLDLGKTRKKISPEYMDEETVISIYTDFWTDKSLSQKQIAKKYGISQGTVSHIASGKSWVEITSKIDLPERVHRSQGNRGLLKDYQIVEIFIRYHKERPTYAALGKEYGVSDKRISHIVRRLYKPELTEGIAI